MVDEKSGSSIGVSDSHHHIHEGDSFEAIDMQTVSNTTQKWMITTPDTKRLAHMVFAVECTGEMLVLATEGADRTGTTLLVPNNRNRVGIPISPTTIVHRDISGGASDGDITLINKRVGATDKFSAAMGEHRGENEFILKPNTKYILSVTTYAAVFVSLHLDWYEHEDRRTENHFNVE